MMKNLKSISFLFVGAILGMLAMYFLSNYKIEKVSDKETLASVSSVENTENKTFEPSDNQTSEIDELTNEKRVITYVKQHKELPDYYITKSEAREGGWVASEGNLCDVLPGKAIGGDRFSNREKQLPAGQQYYEADVNYNCGRRGADRIVFTKDGEVWLTHNHYKTFEKQ